MLKASHLYFFAGIFNTLLLLYSFKFPLRDHEVPFQRGCKAPFDALGILLGWLQDGTIPTTLSILVSPGLFTGGFVGSKQGLIPMDLYENKPV